MTNALVYCLRLDDAPRTPDFPWSIIECRCHTRCYVLQGTIAAVAREGFTPDYVCRACAPAEVTEMAESVKTNQRSMCLPDGATVRVELDIEDEEGGTVH